MEVLSGEQADEYFNTMDDEIQSLMIKGNMWDFSMKSVSDNNVLPGTWSFKWKRKTGWAISILKAQYCVIEDVQKRLSTEPLHSYSPVV